MGKSKNTIIDPLIIRDYYNEEIRVTKYIDTRFYRPLGKYQHEVQVRYVNTIIRKYNIKNILEIACGPARITKEIHSFVKGYAIDYSDKMLDYAKSRVNNKHWIFLKKDAFALDLNPEFELVYTFRFLRHFKRQERGKLYFNIRKVLKNSGLLIFDAICIKKPEIIQQLESKGEKDRLYDKIYKNKNELMDELSQNGFILVETIDYIKLFYIQAIISRLSYVLHHEKLGYNIIKKLDKLPFGKPLEWIVLCQKKG